MGLTSMPTDEPGAVIMYDGECPVCSAYVRFVQLRKAVGTVELIDLRQRPDLVSRFRAEGHDVNDGMVFELDGREYFGADAVNMMAMLSSDNGIVNRLNAILLQNKKVATLTYPILRAGRNALLKLLGRKKIP